jgi:hypothetical protein
MKLLLQTKYFFGLILIFSLCVFLAHTAITKTAIFADARFYFAYTHSLVKDHDLDLKNEYIDLKIGTVFNNTVVSNAYPPGVSLFWIPLYQNADALTRIFGINNQGYGFIYQLSVALTNIFLGVFGLYLIYRLLIKYFSEKVSLLTTLFLFGATNLLFYISVEPINSHAASFFISSLFVFYFLKIEAKKEKDYYMALGFLGGIAGLIRTQDLLILILPAIQILYNFKKDFKTLIKNYLLLTIGIFAGFLPQILLWKYFFNTFWFSPYLNTGFNWLKPQVLYVLFNIQNGLFTFTPIIAVSLIGLFLLKKRFHMVYFYSLIYFLIQLYLTSSWNVYYQGGSYSIRMLITTYPLLSFGLAGLISRIIKSYSEKFVLTFFILTSIINSAFIINYLLMY